MSSLFLCFCKGSVTEDTGTGSQLPIPFNSCVPGSNEVPPAGPAGEAAPRDRKGSGTLCPKPSPPQPDELGRSGLNWTAFRVLPERDTEAGVGRDAGERKGQCPPSRGFPWKWAAHVWRLHLHSVDSRLMGSGGNLARKSPRAHGGAWTSWDPHTLLSVRTCHQEPRRGNQLDTGFRGSTCPPSTASGRST